jgi:uncharacterized protein YecE (DUF72 family)
VTDIHIGTSGWNYPSGRGTWNGLFYPSRRPRGFDELAYYAERFDTVEVNSTFYRMPEPGMSRSWIERTPPGFLFSVKLYQKFTHPDMYLQRDGVKDWEPTRDDFDLFRAGIDPLAAAGRLAAVLVQFPESFHADDDARGYLDWLLGALAEYPLAVELRHRTWHADPGATAALLAEHGASFALADEPFRPLARERGRDSFSATAKKSPDPFYTLYIRLHGRNRGAWWQHETSEDRYNYLYTPDELEPVAEIARGAAAEGRRVLLYMNNHFSAKSVANAVILKRKLGEPIRGDYPPALVDRYPELEGVVPTSGLPL